MQLPFKKQLIGAALIAIVAPSATVIAAHSFDQFVSAPRSSVRFAQTSQPPPGTQPLSAPQPGPTPSSPSVVPLPQPVPNLQPVTVPVLQPGTTQPEVIPVPHAPPVLQPTPGVPSVQPFPQPSPIPAPSILPGRQICPLMPEIPCPTDQEVVIEQGSNGCSVKKCIPKGEHRACPPITQQFCPNGNKVDPTTKCPTGECLPPSTVERPRVPPALDRCAREALGADIFERMIRGDLQPTEEQKKFVRERCAEFKREARPPETVRPSPPPIGEFPGRGEFPGQSPGGEFRGRVPERAPGAPEFGQPPGREFGQQPGGPSREEQERFERERERMEQEQKGRMLQEMKRGIRGAEQGLAMMTRGLRVCAAANVEIPAAVKAGIEKFQTTLAKIRDATNPEQIQDVDFSELPEIGDRVRETIDACHRLRELPRISRQLSGEVRRIEAEVRRVRAQAKRTKLDVAEQLQTIDGAVANVKTTLAEVTKVRTVEESESIMEQLEQTHETLQEIREDLEAIRGVLNVGRGIAEAKRELRGAERKIATLKRQGRDTVELDVLLVEGKALLATLESLARRKPIDVDALVEAFEKLEELGERAENAFAKITGREVRRGVEERFGRSPAESIRLPGAFEQFRKPNMEEGQSGDVDVQGLFGFDNPSGVPGGAGVRSFDNPVGGVPGR